MVERKGWRQRIWRGLMLLAVAAAGVSGAAIRLLYMPMLSQADVLRAQYGRRGVERLLGQQLRSARRFYLQRDVEGNWVYPTGSPPSDEDVGNDTAPEVPVDYYLSLPPRMVEVDVLDSDGQPTGEKSVEYEDRHPGTSEDLRLEWPPYFEPLPSDTKAETDSLQAAAGGKPVLSQQTAVELAARARGRDAEEERRRLEAERAQERAEREAMFDGGGAGGQVSSQDELPAGAEPLPGEGGGGAAISSQADELVHTVNQLRARAGSGPLTKPDGTPDPDGDLPAILFRAKMTAQGTAMGQLVGQAQGEAEAAEVAPPAGEAPPATPEAPPEAPAPTEPPQAGPTQPTPP